MQASFTGIRKITLKFSKKSKDCNNQIFAAPARQSVISSCVDGYNKLINSSSS